MTISRPPCQVVITVNAITAISNGSQAPCTGLVRLAAKDIRFDDPLVNQPGQPAHRCTGMRTVEMFGGDFCAAKLWLTPVRGPS